MQWENTKAREIQEKVLKTIKKHSLIEPGESVLVGVSGGPDSVCLLHVLYSLSLSYQLKIEGIFAVHINHMLRGRESDMDEEYVKELCNQLGIKLFSVSLNIREISDKKGISIEEAAREERYSQFALLAGQIGNCKIAVAHNRNDQAETIIMNIIRGTGLDGLRGMDYKRGKVIRPLLDIGRNEIEEYCIMNNLNPRTDSTNLKSIYTRNKVRLELIPYISKSFSIDMVESINRMADLIRDDYCYLEQVATEKYKECVLNEHLLEACGNAIELDNAKKLDNQMNLVNGIELDIKKIMNCHNAIRKRVIRKAIEKVKGNLMSIESVHIEKILGLCLEGRTGSQICLPHNIRVAKSYNILKIYMYDKLSNELPCELSRETAGENREAKFTYFNKKLEIPGITPIEVLDAYLEATVIDRNSFDVEIFKNLSYNSLVQFFDYDKLKVGINIRNREEGDIIAPYKCKGTKKLKEYFIDSKIPREIRNRIPLIAKGKEIVWVIGYKISDKFKITENTKSILRLEFRKSKN